MSDNKECLDKISTRVKLSQVERECAVTREIIAKGVRNRKNTEECSEVQSLRRHN